MKDKPNYSPIILAFASATVWSIFIRWIGAIWGWPWWSALLAFLLIFSFLAMLLPAVMVGDGR